MRGLIAGPGRMGRAVEAALLARGHSVAGRLGRTDVVADVDPLVVDVAFDFTVPDSAPAVVRALLERGIAVVSGTTGWDVEGAREIARERAVAFLHAPNFSLGVAAMRIAVSHLAAALAPFPEFEPGLLERHHSAKKDAPSGTAKSLAAVAEAALGGRVVPIVALRQGGQPGEHHLFFEGQDESIEIVHRARSRSLFAAGAVRAAEWLLVSGRTGPVSFDDFFERSLT